MQRWLLYVLVDLRFIPDEIDFEQDQIRVQRTTEKKDICNEKPINYTPPDFVSSALTRTKCDLTWDETDKRRTNLLRKSDLVEDQVQHLIASGSEAGFQKQLVPKNLWSRYDILVVRVLRTRFENRFKTDEDDPEALEKREETKRKFQLLLNNEEEDDFFKSNEGNEDTRSDSDEENPVKTEGDQEDGNKEFKMEMKTEGDDSDSDALISDEEKSSNKKNKKRRKNEDEIEETEEVKKERAELELVMMSSSDDEGRKHFDLREEEREKRKNKKKRKFKNQKVLRNYYDVIT